MIKIDVSYFKRNNEKNTSSSSTEVESFSNTPTTLEDILSEIYNDEINNYINYDFKDIPLETKKGLYHQIIKTRTRKNYF